jgi:hypothetical protein
VARWVCESYLELDSDMVCSCALLRAADARCSDTGTSATLVHAIKSSAHACIHSSAVCCSVHVSQRWQKSFGMSAHINCSHEVGHDPHLSMRPWLVICTVDWCAAW